MCGAEVGHSTQGTARYLLEEYDKALSEFKAGLAIYPEHKRLQVGAPWGLIATIHFFCSLLCAGFILAIVN
jgi:hypothetical protein